MQLFSNKFLFVTIFATFVSFMGNELSAMATGSPCDQKRLLIIGDMYPETNDKRGAIGGTEAVVWRVRDILQKRGWTVKIWGHADLQDNYKARLGNFFFGGSFTYKILEKEIKEFNPHHIFIPLLGPIARAAAQFCRDNNIPCTGFNSCRSLQCAALNAGIPLALAGQLSDGSDGFLHNVSNVVVPSASMRDEESVRGIKNVIAWPHGVDSGEYPLATPEQKADARLRCGLEGKQGPFVLWVGRMSREKNLDDFLNARMPGTKIVVGPAGSGYDLDALRSRYPEIVFAGRQVGLDLLKWYHAADIFVFTSKIDTFGLVMLEAAATGLPIVGFNTCGPRDVVPAGCGISYLADLNGISDLERCARRVWNDLERGVVTPAMCRAHAALFSWDRAIDQLVNDVLIKIK